MLESIDIKANIYPKHGTKYSRMDQVKFVEDGLEKINRLILEYFKKGY